MKVYFRSSWYLIIFLLSLFAISFLTSASTSLKKDWSVEDVIKQENAGSFKISPDGKFVLWVKSISDLEKDQRINHIYITELNKKGESIQLTRGKQSDSSPDWSPAGKIISFLSDRKDETSKDESGNQLWLLDIRGGEAWKITSLPFGVFAYEWLDDKRILFLTREDKTYLEKEQEDKKDTSFVVEDQEHLTPYRLFILDIKTKKVDRLTDNIDQISGFWLSSKKDKVITRNNQSVYYNADHKEKPKFYLVDIISKKKEELFTDPSFKPNSFEWDFEDNSFYFTVTRTSDWISGGPGAEFLYYYDLNKKKYAEVPLDWECGLFYYGIQARKDGFVAALANGATLKWRRYYKKKTDYEYKDLEGEHIPNIFGLNLHKNSNSIVYFHSTASSPGQWYLGELKNEKIETIKQITKINEHLNDRKIVKTEVIRWKGALDEEVEGILYYPYDYKPREKYPLVLMIHGGPAGVDMDTFRESYTAYPQLMAGKNAFILRPNYHGSSGYGQKFVESIKGHYYEYEIVDMLNGIDMLIAKGMVDSEKLGTMGWSNGGILTIALSVWTNRFKVAGVGAADVNWISDYGNCAFGVWFDNYYFTGPPWEKLDHYIKKSPLFHLQDTKVPTIIFHGDKDTNVPFSQGWEFYRALQQIGKAPVKFIVFPSQPHGLRKLTHQKRKMEEEIEWFDRYLFDKYTPKNEALKKNSPLDLEIKKLKFEKVDNLYGKIVNDKLISELVKKDDTEVGRFEVTRAQWSSYAIDYKYEVGTGNYPISNISFDQAKKYIEWLNSITGETYRLPGVDEAQQLAKSSGKSGNNLDFWAGYAPNPQDTKLLIEKINTPGGQINLLLPVDAKSAIGEELIYGLDGNVAEWAEDQDGKGVAVGLCAITPSDSMNSKNSPPPKEYIGLRIFKGAKRDKKNNKD